MCRFCLSDPKLGRAVAVRNKNCTKLNGTALSLILLVNIYRKSTVNADMISKI